MTLTLPAITANTIRDALRAYTAIAWNDEPKVIKHISTILELDSPESMLAAFCDESAEVGTARKRWVLRLGNRAYPHMKFVLEESTVAGHFYFCADTHDQVSVNTNVLGLEAWAAVQQQNANIKREIEAAWYAQGIPTLRSVREATGSVRRSRTEASGPNVLVVDDEEDAAQLFSILLARAGFRVSTSLGGEDAIDMVRRYRPDVVLLDYMMDGMSGREVCEILKDDPNTANICVIISTYADVDDRSLAIADAILPKPFKTDDLVALVNRLTRPARNPVPTGA